MTNFSLSLMDNDIKRNYYYWEGIQNIQNRDLSSAIDNFTQAIEICSKDCGVCGNCEKSNFCGKSYYHRGFSYLRSPGLKHYEYAEKDFLKAKEKFKIAQKLSPNELYNYICFAETCICQNILLSKSVEKPSNEKLFDFVQEAFNFFNLYCEEKNEEYDYILGRLHYERGKRHEKTDFLNKKTDFGKAINLFKSIKEKEEYRSFIIRTIANQILNIKEKLKDNDLTLEEKESLEREIKELFESLFEEDNSYQNFKKNESDDKKENFLSRIYNVATFSKAYNPSWIMRALGKTDIDDNIKYLKRYVDDETNELIKNAANIKKYAADIEKGTFYKFYSYNSNVFDKIINGIKNDNVYFADPTEFNNNNDTQDVTTLLNIERRGESDLFKDFLKEINPKIFCLTKDYMNYALWLHYANNFNGFCVAYEIEGTGINQCDGSNQELSLKEYCDTFKNKFLFNPVLYKTNKEYNNIKERPKESYITDILLNILYAKHKHFSYEEEFRLVNFDIGKNSEKGKSIDLKEFGGKISEIRIGNRDFIYSKKKGIVRVKFSDFDESKDQIIKNLCKLLEIAEEKKVTVHFLKDRNTFEFEELSELSQVIKNTFEYIDNKRDACKKSCHYYTNNESPFIHSTLTERFPKIIESIISNNDFDERVKKDLMCLKNSILHSELELLKSNSKVNEEIKKHNYTWGAAPFLFVENYLYHRLCEITGYKNNHTDFFAYKKNEDVINKLPQMTSVIAAFDNILELSFDKSVSTIVQLNLSGNMADLSHLSALKTDKIKLLIDHTDKLSNKFQQAKRIDIILDNSGEELFFDLLLTYWFLKKTNVEKINLHFKTMPYFVSDALISDYDFLMEQLAKDDRNKDFVQSIKEYVTDGKIAFCSNDFWSDGSNFNQMPETLLKDLNQSDLLIFKGDLNYRKLVEDKDWDYTTKTADLIDYFDTDILIIRVLKSEVIVGLQKEKVPSCENKEWTYNAKYGIIELL